MLSLINRRYFLFAVMVMLFFIPFLDGEYYAIYALNIVTLLAFYFTINQILFRTESFYTKQRLTTIVFWYSLFFVMLNNIISYYYRGNFFVFSEADAVLYDNYAIKMAAMPFGEGIQFILSETRYEYDDLGAFVVVSTLYRIVESNLILNLFYVIVGTITSRCIFRISKNFISKRYSFLCALTYSISSFVIWFHSSGLKESFMVMLIVAFYDNYFFLIKNKNIKYLILSIVPLLAVLLFRPAVFLFCIFSVGLSMVFSVKRKATMIVIAIVGGVVSVFLLSFIIVVAQRYVGERGMSEIVERQSSTKLLLGGSIPFTYMVNIVASVIGPLPTILPNNEKQTLSMFSIGLIYRVFLSFAFWLGVYYSIKKKVVFLYPLLLFYFMETISLIILMEGLELRKSLAHFPFIYITSFWFLDYYDKKEIQSGLQRRRVRYLWSASYLILLGAIFFWNFRG